MSVTRFWNAMHIFNNTATNRLIDVRAVGYKQPFSPSDNARNVPNGHTQDSYSIEVPANGSTVLGAGIYRNEFFDQSAEIILAGLGVLTFSGTTTVHGDDISQVTFWAGVANVTAPTGVVWNFNHVTLPVLSLTITTP